MEKLRLDKIIASGGEYSRKQIKQLSHAGRVTVDGKCVRDTDIKLNPNECEIVVDGVKIAYRAFYHIMMNKPAGIITATRGHGEVCALDLLAEKYRKAELAPAGRLDKDAEGFLLFTNDGALAHAIISPKNLVDKVYYVRTDGILTEREVLAFQNRVVIDGDFLCASAKLELISPHEAYVTVHEGRFHQVKKMFLSQGRCVKYLKRISIGGVKLDFSLQTGEFRELSQEEEKTIYNAVFSEKT